MRKYIHQWHAPHMCIFIFMYMYMYIHPTDTHTFTCICIYIYIHIHVHGFACRAFSSTTTNRHIWSLSSLLTSRVVGPEGLCIVFLIDPGGVCGLLPERRWRLLGIAWAPVRVSLSALPPGAIIAMVSLRREHHGKRVANTTGVCTIAKFVL